ncbi:hypothetical protein QDG88_04860 [Pseudoalteromonas piscicida]|uniref:pre-peptidase C-terminal domain-containing protein n=1 Tax=Pseudoalteromonas piscicida TaxID=43662 RepID=UPI002739D982|nr:pre-peptidase C-terminal domain-containing protein [Pseudoalteromonas piscicida]MDP4487282.1 hypothetical protein [Pseudoalteromonas piscicida]
MLKSITNSVMLLTIPVVVQATDIASGVSVEGSIKKGNWDYYQIQALSQNTRLKVTMNELTDDADLYVRIFDQPTQSNYTCRPYKGQVEDEVCDLNTSAENQIHIGVYGFQETSYRLKVNLASLENNLNFPADGTDWEVTLGSDYHTATGGFRGMNDTFALDLNRPMNADDNLDVTPVADGTVILANDEYGFVLVQHDTDLMLGDGTTLNPWFSGYMHMSGILSINEPEVTTNTVLGQVSNVKASNDHLHFGVYSGSATNIGGMVSIDVGNILTDLYWDNITTWHEWCDNTPRATHSESQPWWSSGVAPCPYN